MKLNGGKHVQGRLQAFDLFIGHVIHECVQMATGGQQSNSGTVVPEGKSSIMLEALERESLSNRYPAGESSSLLRGPL
ncbi:small nuclear ribonucleoprotein G-like [Acomys russatus]|uniref:small nuclear ribonucleoprotein G-like n=1 Tax=Acomys russatus TaxID=60746 RepID=UPI0021E263E9|nr:small nuclear ribonucleoprotein G-like [Acomys russatus]